ncbi:MAG: ABC transporter ATP-binding protein [Deltaproteobacteria bacterium]|nr:ABC transporter ATP-binding protein [Deltaproteobacteria bacterium]
MSRVSLTQAVKKYGNLEVIHGITLAIEDGEFCVFVGPSGCGKSTLLRMIAGLEETTAGNIEIGKRNVTKIEPGDRGVAMVFQTYALYPHMTVAENMGFGLKMTGHPKSEVRAKIQEASRILHLDDYLDRKPKALSGGQRQRVAIGRAIVRGPEVFLFDEPLSNLDAELRVDMRVEIARLHKEIGATMIYVTHDQVEAMTLADRIVVLRNGSIEQVGRPMDIYHDPENKFVAGFIGSPAMNFFEGYVHSGKVCIPTFQDISIATKINLPSEGSQITVGIRPQNLIMDENGTEFTLEIHERLGGVNYGYITAATGERIIVENKGDLALDPRSKVSITFSDNDVLFFDVKTEMRIK